MSSILQQLVQQIAPDLDISRVQITRDNPLWYRVVNGRLFVPPINVLQRNIVELDKFVESIKAFNATDSEYDWDHLDLIVWDEVNYTLEDLHAELLEAKICAVDIETKRIEWEDNKMLSIGFAYNDIRAVAIKWPELTPKGLEKLQEILADERITFIWHNGKFDCTRLKYLAGIDARVDEDTMLMHYACINERRGTHGLKDLGPLYLQAPQWDDELQRIRREFATRNKCNLSEFTFDMLPIDVLIPYMQRDCIATLRLWHLFKKLQAPGTDWIYRKLCQASNVYKEVELAGFQIDMEYLEELEYTLDLELTKAEQVLNKAVADVWNPRQYVIDTGTKSWPKEFNIKSPKQLKWLLEQVVGHKLASTDAETVESLKGDNPEHEKLLDALKTYRKVGKQIDTYICGIRGRVCRDHRIRGSFNLHGTETGRLSSSDPNMQNIPMFGPIKGLFVAAPGKTILQLDYSQAELRVLAYLSGDEFMTNVYQENRDIHSEVATLVFGNEFTKAQRQICKQIIFGSIYGRGPVSVAEQVGCTVEEAKEIIVKVFKYMPKARDWIANRRNMATKGEDCINPFGRRRNFVMMDRSALNHLQNEYVNTPVQSTASDCTMMALLEIHEAIKARGLDGKIISSVHDSIMLEVDPKDVEEITALALDIMATLPSRVLPNCTVPFKADAETGFRWSEVKKA